MKTDYFFAGWIKNGLKRIWLAHDNKPSPSGTRLVSMENDNHV